MEMQAATKWWGYIGCCVKTKKNHPKRVILACRRQQSRCTTNESYLVP